MPAVRVLGGPYWKAPVAEGSSIDVADSGINISPDPSDVSANEDVTVTITVPFSEVSWMPPFLYDGTLSASTTMRSEKIE